MKIDFHSKLIFIGFIAFGTISLYFWWRTVNKQYNNDKTIQGLDIMSGLLLSYLFVLMVYEHTRKKDHLKRNEFFN